MNNDTNTTTGRKKKRIAIISVSAVLVAALATGGAVAIYQHSASAQLAEAKEACARSSETLRVARNKYDTLHDKDAAEAVKITDKQVTDAAVVTTLAKTYKEDTPDLAACNVSGVDALREAKERIDKNTAWYDTHTADLSKAVDAVNASHDAKTLKDAKDALSKQITAAQEKYKATDGKVKDDKTRKGLKTLIDKAAKTKDGEDVKAMNEQAKQLNTLMGKVDASVKAKQDADRKAAEEKARKEAAAAAAAQAQAQQQYVAPQETYTAPQQTYTAPQQSYTPTYTAPQQSAPQQSAPAPAAPAAPSTGGGSGSGPVSGGHGMPGHGEIVDSYDR